MIILNDISLVENEQIYYTAWWQQRMNESFTRNSSCMFRLSLTIVCLDMHLNKWNIFDGNKYQRLSVLIYWYILAKHIGLNGKVRYEWIAWI